MKNRLRNLSDEKRAEINQFAETNDHEGQRLRKVDREAQIGDYIRPNDTICGSRLEDGVIYGPVYSGFNERLRVDERDGGCHYYIYSTDHNRTLETVEVFEVDTMPEEVESQQVIHYFSFGAGHNLDGYVLPIVADSPDAAREKMFELYGGNWSFQYTAVEWQRSLADGYFKNVKMLPKVFCNQESEGK